MNGLPPRLVLFDGVCGLCDRTIQFLLERDSDATLKGFDDRQRLVEVVNPRTGVRERTVKRA